MNENITEEQINSKYIIAKEGTSIFVFMIPTLILLIILVYIITTNSNLNSLFLLGAPLILFAVNSISYLYSSIILTESTLYVFKNNKCVFKIKLIDGFNIYDTPQNAISSFFNYGTFVISNLDSEYYEYKFLTNPLILRKKIITTYVRQMKKINSDFEPSVDLMSYLEDKNNNNIDRIG